MQDVGETPKTTLTRLQNYTGKTIPATYIHKYTLASPLQEAKNKKGN